MEIDWGDGDYGRTAAALAPAAEVLLARERAGRAGADARFLTGEAGASPCRTGPSTRR